MRARGSGADRSAARRGIPALEHRSEDVARLLSLVAARRERAGVLARRCRLTVVGAGPHARPAIASARRARSTRARSAGARSTARTAARAARRRRGRLVVAGHVERPREHRFVFCGIAERILAGGPEAYVFELHARMEARALFSAVLEGEVLEDDGAFSARRFVAVAVLDADLEAFRLRRRRRVVAGGPERG